MKNKKLIYDWDMTDLRPEGKDSVEFYKQTHNATVLSITHKDKTVWIQVDGEMSLSRTDGDVVARTGQDLPNIGVTDEETLGDPDVHFSRNPWFDAYEDVGPFEDGHLDIVNHTLTDAIAGVVEYFNKA